MRIGLNRLRRFAVPVQRIPVVDSGDENAAEFEMMASNEKFTSSDASFSATDYFRRDQIECVERFDGVSV
jgi:hypothetical protein